MISTPERPVPPVVLAIAGSEASGDTGAQTDLKTFHQLGVFGCTTLTYTCGSLFRERSSMILILG